jgi:hypothetical protein
MRRFLFLPVIVLCAGCIDVTGPTVGLNERFTLAPNETAQVKEARTSLTFNGVEGDSRCPADALCVQGGDARVKIEARSGGSTRSYELHTGDMKPVVHEGLTITLVQLSPYPFGGTTIKPGDYRATLTVSR